MMFSYIDAPLTLFFKHLIPHDPLFVQLFSFFSFLGSYAFIWIVISVFLIILEEKRDKRFIFSMASSLTITYIVVTVLKVIIARPRPPHFVPICPQDFSFPSLHAALSFCAATILSRFDKKRRTLYYTGAALITYSRVFLGCHYLLDIVIGSLVGLSASLFILKNTLSETKKQSKKKR